jgi:hypothetical protein
MNDVELAPAGRVHKSLCRCCMTMLALPGETHRCPHGKPCLLLDYEDGVEWSCTACRDAFSERERLRLSLPLSASEVLRTGGERRDANVSAPPAAWRHMVAWLTPRLRKELLQSK